MVYTVGMDEEYITLQQATEIAGYRNDSTLRAAARAGRLKTKSFGPRARLTTETWLQEYLVALRPGAYGRGTLKGKGEATSSEGGHGQ